MKRGSEYAKRIKQLFQQMVRKLGKVDLPEPTDPIHQLIIAILAENTSEAKAATLFGRICELMVDLNELRVTPPLELAELIGNTVPQAREKAERIVRVLNEIRARQDTLDLSFLKQRGRREAREYLESLEGVGSSAAASVVVHSLGGHAVPVDYLTVYVLRKEDFVEGTATAAEVQSFLERHVAASDCRIFATLLNRHAAAEGARVQISRLPEILNLEPPKPLKPPKRMVMEKPIRPAGAKGEGIEVELDPEAVAIEAVLLAEPDADVALLEIPEESGVELAGASAHHKGGKDGKAGKVAKSEKDKAEKHKPKKDAAKKAVASHPPAKKSPASHKPTKAKADSHGAHKKK